MNKNRQSQNRPLIVLLMDLTFDGKTKYEHAALIVDIAKKDVYYAAHTSNRWRHSLWQEIDAGNVEGFVVYNISSSAK